ncbi:hypothetical protein SLA2020_273760 [Shorea laevis]
MELSCISFNLRDEWMKWRLLLLRWLCGADLKGNEICNLGRDLIYGINMFKDSREVSFVAAEFLDPQWNSVVYTSILREEWMKWRLLLLTLGFAVLT